MTGLAVENSVDGAIDHLVQIAEAQAAALIEPDLETFVRLTSERDRVQTWLQRERRHAFSPAQLAELRGVAQLDERNVRTLQQLLRDTAAELQSVHRGRG